MGTEIYGFGAFVLTIIASFFMHVPVLSICIAYQLFYLIRYKWKKGIDKKDIVFDVIYIISLIVSNYVVGLFFMISKLYQRIYIIYYFIKKHKSKNVVADNNSELQDKN